VCLTEAEPLIALLSIRDANSTAIQNTLRVVDHLKDFLTSFIEACRIVLAKANKEGGLGSKSGSAVKTPKGAIAIETKVLTVRNES
jgi:hypothetical protein